MGGGQNSRTQVERRLSRGLQTKMGVGVTDYERGRDHRLIWGGVRLR